MSLSFSKSRIECLGTVLRWLISSEKPAQNISAKAHIGNSDNQEKETGAKRCFVKILLPRLVRCWIGWCLIAGFYVSLWSFKDRVISPRTKSVFDTITIGLSIAFGMSIASSLKGVALDLRWWILSTGKRPSQEVRFTLREDALKTLLTQVPLPRLSWFYIPTA